MEKQQKELAPLQSKNNALHKECGADFQFKVVKTKETRDPRNWKVCAYSHKHWYGVGPGNTSVMCKPNDPATHKKEAVHENTMEGC